MKMKTVFLFSGQGAQYPGMLLDIVKVFPKAREIFDIANEATKRNLDEEIKNFSPDELNKTINTQPCMMACELAVFNVLRDFGISYDAVTGFSLGEWAAVVASGTLSEYDAMKLIVRRAGAMQSAVPEGKGGMAFMLGKDDEYVAQFCSEVGDVVPANYNIQGNVSVAGTVDGIDKFLVKGESEGIMVGRIPISIPSHCWLMQPAVDELNPFIRGLKMDEPNKRIYMNATGTLTEHSTDIKDNLVNQLIKPVRFHQILDTLFADDYNLFIEVGPGNTLSKMVKRAAKLQGCSVEIMQAGTVEDIEKICERFGK